MTGRLRAYLWRVRIIGPLALLLSVLLGLTLFDAHAIFGDLVFAQNTAAPARPAPTAPAARVPAEQKSAQAQAKQLPEAAQGQEAMRIPIRTEISRFDGWIVTCNEFSGGPKIRECESLLRITQQKTNQVVFSWTVGLNGNSKVVATFQTPTGVLIAPGIELQIGNAAARKIPFTSCEAGRCVSTTMVDAAMLREMTTASTAKAVIQGAQGSTVDFNIEMKGFDKAYAILSRP